MIYYLDTNIVIYSLEHHPLWSPTTRGVLSGLKNQNVLFAVSDLTCMECRIGPLRRRDRRLLDLYDAFFAAKEMHVHALPTAVFERAAVIRATHGYKALDALHLATAVEFRCDRFLTNDNRLSDFSDISVELLDI
ncbi:MAG: PIN domain-containing protein [Pirellulales bacterium]|nr:PIN domain-containing protein [Pirellulales bacterium]